MSQIIAFLNPKLTTTNVGDYFIEDSVKRILKFDSERSIDIDPRKPIDDASLDRINECDAAVIVGTNLWYRQIYKEGRWMLSKEQLKKIRVPIIPLGIGTTRHKGDDNGFTSESIEILKLVHGSCQKGSVRDIRTLEALEQAGISNAVMTGCPTLFRSLHSEWRLRTSNSNRRVVVTVRKGQRENVRKLYQTLQHAGWSPIVAAQKQNDKYFCRSIPFIQRAIPVIYEFDIKPYLKMIDESFGAIGWRLHGNMFHLSLGNPAVFFSNCSRAQSFCEAFHLPVIAAEDGERVPDHEIEEATERLEDPAAFSGFNERYRYFYQEMADFLDANNLEHRLNV